MFFSYFCMKFKHETTMKKTGVYLALFGIVFCLTTSAQQRSEEEAKKIAEKYLQSITGKTTSRQLQKAPVKGPRKISAQTGEIAYYIFNDTDDSAFVIVSADERMKDVLGYCNHSTYVTEQAPEALKCLLDEYATQYEIIQEGKTAKRKSAQKKMPHYLVTNPLPYKNVSALLQTKWGQGNPYNKYCPYVGNKQCITGCLATAMAQVMNFHKYPYIGSGSITYTSKTNNMTLTASFSDPKYYNWNSMLANYVNNYTTAQADAVANLMKACGIGLGMDYGIDWSEANYSDIPYSLHTFFRYNRNVAYISRNYFKTEEWIEIITNEVLNGRPVIYNGNDEENGGHSFVLDGVWDKERFHINWGWNSYYDGFYALDAFTPYSDVDYEFYQSAIINITPTDVGIHQDVYYAENFEVSETQVNSEQEFTAFLHNVWNYSNSASSKIESTTFNGYMGLAMYSTNMKLIDVLAKYRISNKMYWGWDEFYLNISLNKNKFPENDSCYLVPVIINSEEEVTPIRTMHAESDAVLAIKKNSVILLKTLREVEITEFEDKGIVYTWIPNKKGCVAVKGCISVPSNGIVTIPSTVTFRGDVYVVNVISEYAFFNNEKVKVLDLSGSIDSIGSSALANMTALITLRMNRNIPPHVADYSAFYGITDVKLLVPADCRDTYMQDETWKVFTNIEEEPLVIADFTYNGIQYTQNPNRANCVMVKTNKSTDVMSDIVIPEEVHYKDKILKVTALAEKAFYKCENITSLELPATIDSISRYALASMKGLTGIKVKAVNPPKVPNKAVFSGITSIPLTVPYGCTEIYKSHSYWSAFTSIIEDEGDIDAINNIKKDGMTRGKTFDLSGRKLSPSVQGHQRQIVIKGGKKYVSAFSK